MRKFYNYVLFIAVLFLQSSIILAQPTLTSSANNPSIGESYTMHTYDATSVSPGPSGANVTWDFSTVSSTSSNTFTYVTPSSGNNFGDFPSSTAAVLLPNQAEIYYKTDSDELSYSGLVTNNEITFDRYTNEREILKYPLTYLDVYNETFSGTHENTQSTQTYDRSGQITIEGDGYGTLITPFGTFNNILRVKVVTDYADTSGSTHISSYKETSYFWYSANLSATYFTHVEFEFIDFSSTSYSGNYLDPASVSIEDKEKAEGLLAVFPNPVSDDQATVVYNTNEAQRIELSIINLVGQKVFTKVNSHSAAGVHNAHLDLSDVVAGTYILQLVKGKEVITKKITIK